LWLNLVLIAEIFFNKLIKYIHQNANDKKAGGSSILCSSANSGIFLLGKKVEDYCATP
jgi:hypothetical protein